MPAWRHPAPAIVALSTLLLAGCIHQPPHVAGASGAPASPRVFWTPPQALKPRTPPASAAKATAAIVPRDLRQRAQNLTMADVVDLALRNNPATQVSWAQSRAAADAYGVQRARWLPTLSLSGTATESKTLQSSVRYGGLRKQGNVSLTLSYLLLDLGTRAGAVGAAKASLVAAGLTHNSTVQGVVLQVENAYFNYVASRALLQAQRASVKEAQANLEAAQHRHDVGLATIADVLQARTALSQAQLSLESLDGGLKAARGALAVAMGLPANLPYDINEPEATPVHAVSADVDSLIAEAVKDRPDLAAAEARAQGARALVMEARGQALPSINLTGDAGRTFSDVSAFQGNTYSVGLSLSLPLFSGLSHLYAIEGAEAQAKAAQASAEGLRQQVVEQVFTSYYALQTATQRVRTSDDLLTSATESEKVASGRYKQGVGSIIDLLTAQSALANARAQQVQAHWTWFAALARLAHDVGVLGLDGKAPIPLSPDTLQHR